MTDFIINFLNNNLIMVIITLFLLIVFSFKNKYVRSFYFTMVTLVVSAITIYFLHDLSIVGNNFYNRTLRLVCLLMHMFEILVSLVFGVQIKMFENINIYSFVSIFIYTFNIILNVDFIDINLLEYLANRCTLIKTNLVQKIDNKIENNKEYSNNLSSNFVVMLC